MKEIFEQSKAKKEATYADEQPLVDIDLSRCDASRKQRVISLINTIAKNSPTGKKLLEGVAENNYQLKMTPNFAAKGSCSDTLSDVMISSIFEDETLLTTLCHEARHVQQIAAGFPCSVGEFDFKSGVMVHRAKEADAEVNALIVAYELNQNGITAPLNYLKEELPEMTQPFLAGQKEGENTVTPKMKQEAFLGWYQNKPRLEGYEKATMGWALDASWDERNEPEKAFTRTCSSKEIVEAICVDDNGQSYWKDNVKVLEAPERTAVLEATVKKCAQTNLIRKSAGWKEEETYKTLPTHESLKNKKPALDLAKQVAFLKQKGSR